MRNFIPQTMVACLLLGCSQGEFAGDSGSAAHQLKKCIPAQDPTCKPTSGTPTSETPGITIDDGGSIADCGKESLIEDPDQTYAFAAGEERTFLNSLNQYVQIPVTYQGQGAIHGDQATADTVCKLKGFSRAVTFATGSWYSCGDNVNSTWVDASKSFILANACVSNLTLKNTLCKGRLYDKCAKDKSWIFQKL